MTLCSDYRHEHADTESGEVKPVNVESEHVQHKSTPPLLKHVSNSSKSLGSNMYDVWILDIYI